MTLDEVIEQLESYRDSQGGHIPVVVNEVLPIIRLREGSLPVVTIIG